MKKVLIITILMLLTISVSVGAIEVGDKIGEAVYSDITAYVNNYPIPSYVINDYAVIIAEDLRNYCCDVMYDDSTRTLSITKSASKNEFNVSCMYKTSMETGAYFTDVLYTDIKTYVNGNEVTSFNVNGKTMIVIDEFGKYMDGYIWDSNNRAAQAWLTEKPTTEYKPLTKRTEMLFKNGTYDSYVWETGYLGWSDFDFDGTNESISVTIAIDKNDQWEREYMTVKMGNYSKRLQTCDASIDDIYLCDIDLTDGVKDLVIITTEYSDDPVLRIFRYDSNLPQYAFKTIFEGETYTNTDFGTGYVSSHYFKVNDDGTMTIKEQTPSMGMWHVYKTYRRNLAGEFEEIPPAHYEVLFDIMQERIMYDTRLSGYELDMWNKGYIKAYTKYYGEGIVINKGDYFKVLYDNGNNYIYVEKTDGQAGWIYITSETFYLNELYFACAG